VESPTPQTELDEKRRGEITFTVTNHGAAQDRVVFVVEPGDGAAKEWFTVTNPQQLVSANGSVSYQVQVRVPPDVAAGEYECIGRAYSADRSPEDNSATSNRIKFQVKGVAAAPKFKIEPWMWIVAGAVVLVLLVVVGLLVFGGGDEVDPAEEVVLDNKTLTIPPNRFADLDSGTIVNAGGTIQFRVAGAPEPIIQPIGAVKMAERGVVANPNYRTCADADLRTVFIPIRVLLTPGTVLCVETPQQRMAVITVGQPVANQFNFQYDLFRHKSAG